MAEHTVDDSGDEGDLGESPTLEEEFGDKLAAILRSDPIMPEFPTPLPRELRKVQNSASACELLQYSPFQVGQGAP